MNELHHKECIVSYLAVLDPGLGRHINDCIADDVSEKLGILHNFTRLDDDETAGEPCEPGLIVDPSPGNVDVLHVGPSGEGPFFGPALSRAREMERNQVIFPRIAVEEEVFRRLRSDESLWTQDNVLRNEMDIIDCMTTADEAGLHYIDYLSAGLGYFDYDFARYVELLGHHKHFVETRLADTALSGDPEMYLWLKNYHDARIDDDISRSDRDSFVDESGHAMASALAPLRIN